MRKAIILLFSLAMIGSVAWWIWPNGMNSRARRNWKDAAVADIQSQASDPAWIDGELLKLKDQMAAQPDQHASGNWFSDDLILMKSGEWMICRNVCSKEKAKIPDLFVGRGSDGKWYYSTFHFCIAKEVLRLESQPETLATFVHGYWLEPFDGRSDESLNPTWTGGAYGAGRP